MISRMPIGMSGHARGPRRINAAVRRVRIPVYFADQVYDLRGHIDLVRQRLAMMPDMEAASCFSGATRGMTSVMLSVLFVVMNHQMWNAVRHFTLPSQTAKRPGEKISPSDVLCNFVRS